MEVVLQNINIPADPPTISNILNSYNLNKLPSENIAALEAGFMRDAMVSTVNFIKTMDKDYPNMVKRITKRNSRTKRGFAGDISIFVHGITPLTCQACEAEYIHTAAENTDGNIVKCFLCNRLSHKDCYKTEEEIKPGLYFICSVCVAKNESVNLDSSLNQTQITSAQPRKTEEEGSKKNDDEDDQGENSDNHSTSTSESSFHNKPQHKVNHKEKDVDKICPMYLENTCPHGISGKGCTFNHPARCNRYSKFGEDNRRGCTRGRKCWYFHPRLCQNSVTMKMCLTKTCKETHLVGTRRSAPRDEHYKGPFQDSNTTDYEQSYNNRSAPRDDHYKGPFHDSNKTDYQQSYNNKYKQRELQHVNPWNRPEEKREVNIQTNSNEAENTSHFLVKYLESMKADLEKSLEQKLERALQSRVPTKEYQAEPTMQHQINPQQAMQTQAATQVSNLKPQFIQPVNHGAPEQPQNLNPYLQVHPQLLNQYSQHMMPAY